LAISAAFAGPLIGPCSAEGGGIHFRGPSSIGKSTALHVAGSVWGGGDANGYVRSWRATANGPEIARTSTLYDANGLPTDTYTYTTANVGDAARTVRTFDAALTISDSIDPIDPSFRYDINRPISPESYSALRAPFSAESPSLNPSGALASLGRSSVTPNGRRADADDMMVVADVFSNGAASLADAS
jgi:hypothetical protein